MTQWKKAKCIPLILKLLVHLFMNIFFVVWLYLQNWVGAALLMFFLPQIGLILENPGPKELWGKQGESSLLGGADVWGTW